MKTTQEVGNMDYG